MGAMGNTSKIGNVGNMGRRRVVKVAQVRWEMTMSSIALNDYVIIIPT